MCRLSSKAEQPKIIGEAFETSVVEFGMHQFICQQRVRVFDHGIKTRESNESRGARDQTRRKSC